MRKIIRSFSLLILAILLGSILYAAYANGIECDSSTSVLKHYCPDGYTYDESSNKCVGQPVCTAGTFDPSYNECVMCALGTTYDSSSNSCVQSQGSVACPNGFSLGEGLKCFGEPKCPNNGIFDAPNDRCITKPIEKCEPKEKAAKLPFCSKRCYDARAIIYNTPINWDYSDGTKTFNLEIKKGLIITGIIRPYKNGCFAEGSIRLCVNSGVLTLTFTYPDGTSYSVSGNVLMKYWNTFRATVNPNIIGLFVRQHGTNERTFKYRDLEYKPLDEDKVGYIYNTSVTFKRMSDDPYEWVEVKIESGKADVPFCGEQIGYCDTNYLATHAWKEGDRLYYGAVVAKSVDAFQRSSSLYRRNKIYETEFNTGDLYVGSDDIKAGILGYWIGADESFGVYQKDYKGKLIEIYGHEIDFKSLTPKKIGFYREKKDYPSYFYGFESNRKDHWLDNQIPYPALWTDTGRKIDIQNCSNIEGGKCASMPLSVSCPDGYTYQNGKCIREIHCPENGIYNPQTDRCEKQPSCYIPKSEMMMVGYVVGVYKVALNRKPDPEGYNFWKNHFSATPTYDDIYAFLFEARKHKETICGTPSGSVNVTDKELKVTAAYLWYLGRCPDPEGYDNWVNDPNFSLDTFIAFAQDECATKEKCPDPPFIMECPEGYKLVDEICVSDPCADSRTGNVDCGSYQFDSSSRMCIKTDVCGSGDILDPEGDYCYTTNVSASCPSGTKYNPSTGYCVSNFTADKVITDDGLFKDKYRLCPAGQVELYQGDNKDYEGKCFTYKEPADCYKGSVNGYDEDRFGNYCYLQQHNPPSICPSDGRSYTVIQPPQEDYICETTISPKCDSGDYRKGGGCYYQTSPQCPLPNGELSGGSCTGYLSASCPFGSLDTSRDECVATASASCPSGYSDVGTYCEYTYSATYVPRTCTRHYKCNPHECNCHESCSWHYNWDEHKWEKNCHTVCSTCYDTCEEEYDCSYYTCPHGGSLHGTTCVKTASQICPSGYGYVSSRDICEKTTYPHCPSGYSYNRSVDECTRTISSCSYEAIGKSGYSYDPSAGICLKYKEDACNANNPYNDWSYDSSRDICYYHTPAQCPSPQERKVDPDTHWSACYLLENQTTSYYPQASKTDAGRIYCRNDYYYWKDRCYKLEGIACEEKYYNLKSSKKLVVIGKGNSYDEWTGRCWVKIEEPCGYNSYPLRGEFSTEIHCLHKEKDLSKNVLKPKPKDFSLDFCNYLAKTNFNASCNVDVSAIKHDAFGIGNIPPDPTCPIDSNSKCSWIGGSMYMCGIYKSCAACLRVPNNGDATFYGDINKIRYDGNKIYGLAVNLHSYQEAQSLVSGVGGRLPNSSEKSAVENAFKMSADFWLADQQSDIVAYKPTVVVWDNENNFGFVSECLFDDKGDMLCTADMIECVNGKCPYGDQYPCQPYKGKDYCSKFSNICLSLADTKNVEQIEDTQEGLNDKKNDGKIDKNGCEGTVYIFNGSDMRCRLAGVKTGFVDCCKKKKDWFGFGKCKKSEIMLQQKVEAGQCHKVGTYCSVKIFGICLQRKKTYCCFNSKLGRIVQEQARATQGLPAKDWGEAKKPICWGFTPDEFQALDWDKIDLSEYYKYIQDTIIKKSYEDITGKVQDGTYENKVKNKIDKFK